MRDSISARGYTSVILVLDMRQFVLPEHQALFESIRGSGRLTKVLRSDCFDRISKSEAFIQVDQDVSELEPRTSREEIGFISGIFRQNMLDEYATPTYALCKDRIHFPDLLTTNLQFKELFLDVWRRWDVYIRPTMTGMFVVTLTRRYDKATPILTVASDVVKLQMVFDIPGARQRLRELEQRVSGDAVDNQTKQATIKAFLEWMDRDPERGSNSDYVPVQWKLAIEVCNLMVDAMQSQIPVDEECVGLRQAGGVKGSFLHDSYVIYHIDELTALELVVNKARQEALAVRSEAESAPPEPSVTTVHAAENRHQVLVSSDDIRYSAEIQRTLIQLIEGSILEKTRRKAQNGKSHPNMSSRRSNRYFPTHRPEYISEVFRQDRATWNDEICLLAPRAAIVIPSHRAGRDALFISNFAATTGKVMYAWYWGAMERMVEFIVEIRVLAQLMERTSATVLQEFVQALSELRVNILRRDARVEYQRLVPLIDQVGNLSRLVGVCQGLSNPSVWSRAEYAVEKARHLMEQQDVPLLLTHTERNVNNLSSLLDHADELYLAELAARSNQETFWLSLVLAGLSLSITLFALPSFWADLDHLNNGANLAPLRRSLIGWTATMGDVLAPILILGALSIALAATIRFLLFRTRHRRRRQQQRVRRLVTSRHDRPVPTHRSHPSVISKSATGTLNGSAAAPTQMDSSDT
jgi:hypothetical protein